jgi:hypothetical protein
MTTTVEFTRTEPETGALVRIIGIAEPGEVFSADVEFTALIARSARRRRSGRRLGAHPGSCSRRERYEAGLLPRGRQAHVRGLDLEALDLTLSPDCPAP